MGGRLTNDRNNTVIKHYLSLWSTILIRIGFESPLQTKDHHVFHVDRHHLGWRTREPMPRAWYPAEESSSRQAGRVLKILPGGELHPHQLVAGQQRLLLPDERQRDAG